MNKAVLLSSLSSSVRRHYWAGLAAFTSVLGASVAYLVFTPPLYEASSRLMIDDQGVSISDLGRTLTEVGEGPAKGVNPIATQAELVTSQEVLKQSLEKVFPAPTAKMGEIPTVESLRKGLSVTIVPATNILELDYLNSDPELAAKIVNAIATSTVEENIEAIRAEASAVRQFLEAKIPEQQNRLEQAEAAESEYRQVNGIVSLEAQTDNLIVSLSELENEERTLLGQLREFAEQTNLLQQVTGVDAPKTAYEAVRVGQDDELNQLRTRLTTLEAAIIENQSRLGDQHPELLALIEQRDELQSLYAQKLSEMTALSPASVPDGTASNELSQTLIAQYITGEVERRALESRLAVVRAERRSLESRVAEIPLLQRPLAALVRQRQEAENTLQLLQSKLEEARIAEAQLVSTIRIIGRAEVPVEPAEPSPAAILVIGGVMGLVLALGVILALEAIDQSLRSATEAEELLKLPVLGVLPKLPPETPTPEHLEQFLDNPTLIEPYHALLKALELRHDLSASNGHSSIPKPRIIVVSSAFVGEGKSAVVTLLAAVAAMLSRRTLIIDADLRQPLQSRFFKLSNHLGLTEAINGDRSFLEVVQPSGIENLSILPHGRLLSRPSTLPEAASMQYLLQDAAFLYDWIIIDAAAATTSADVVTFSQYTDGLVLVVRPSFMPRNRMSQVVSELRQSGTSILGVVLNETTIPGEEANLYSAREQVVEQPLSYPMGSTSRKA